MSDWAARKALVALILIVIGCAYFSFGEMRYVIWGRTADARVVRMERVVVQGRRGMPYPKLQCEYEFADDQATRVERDDLSADWPEKKPGETIQVQYIPGTASSRVKGNDHSGWLWASGVVLVLGVISGGVWWKFRDAA